jgi:hypothetical protein
MRKQAQVKAKLKRRKPPPVPPPQHSPIQKLLAWVLSRRDYRPMYIALVVAAALHYVVITAFNISSVGVSIAIGIVLAYLMGWFFYSLTR